ncbi:AMP-binding protein [Microbacterium rhizomatis]|uniref:AMP-binding protein n=1 Tax=Microbacterium rhizomatis TaxID=1631477 RepID=A0A5J5J7A0_9MICO|nr:AMP-binding protein [Microbacterium rhizomatis]KAA9110663.1 AMP-binding protein [Microbacterium rhizomatis]
MTHSLNAERFRDARDRLVATREDYDAATAEFAWPQIDGPFNWAIDWFDAFARGNDEPALIVLEEDGGRTTRSFAEMVTRSDQLARWLAERGVSRGDAVLLMLGNQVELWEAMLALTKLGAVILPTTLAIGGADLEDRLVRGSVTHVIAAGDHADKFSGLSVEVAGIRVGEGPEDWVDYADAFAMTSERMPHPGTLAHDPLLHYFTSGTTSRPKLVEHTHVSYPVGHLTTMYWLGLRPGDIHLAISSPGWAKHAWSCFFAPWIAESTIFVYNYGRFDADRMLQTIRSEGITSFCAPPTVWRMLIQADLSGGPGALREVVSAGEPLNPEVISQVRGHWDLTIRDGYGQTEMTAVIANSPGQPIKEGAMGRPMPGCPIVLIDPLTGEEAAEGEICIDLSQHPTNIMTGYVADPDRNAESTAGGYFHTGDIAYRDDDGYLTYVGRTDDIFKASDYKISPFELESVLVEHPAVVEAAVVPAPDAIRLAVPKAYVVLAAGVEPTTETAHDILLYARNHLAPFQRIRRIEFFDLPKTISGKIRRVELRQREERIARGEEVGDEWRDDQIRDAPIEGDARE